MPNHSPRSDNAQSSINIAGSGAFGAPVWRSGIRLIIGMYRRVPMSAQDIEVRVARRLSHAA